MKLVVAIVVVVVVVVVVAVVVVVVAVVAVIFVVNVASRVHFGGLRHRDEYHFSHGSFDHSII